MSWWTPEILQEGSMRCKMRNYTLLKAPIRNILTEELKTREELSQILPVLSKCRQSFEDQEVNLRIESISDFSIVCVQLMRSLAIEVPCSIKTVLRQLCVPNVSHFIHFLFIPQCHPSPIPVKILSNCCFCVKLVFISCLFAVV